ncbi:MAG TPA: MltA domain-containing protein [Tepidisphaeraceae bacterium]|nr:MltA domain-containing protein [Tepidisphaeraceae bacterium]
MSVAFARRFFSAFCLFGLVWFAGCKHESPPPVARAIDFRQPLPDGMVALRKIDPSEYPNFAEQPINPQRLRTAIDNSLEYLAAPSSERFFPYLDITHQRAAATLEKLRSICDQAVAMGAWNPAWFNQQIAADFDVYKSYGAPTPDGTAYTDRVLFTGYCTPIYDASLHRTGEYRWPLYKLPADLDRDPMTGQVHGRKTAEGQIVPYYTRAEIETGGKLAGDELVWLRSRWEAYVVTIQGSARLRLADTGQIYEIGFAGTNGYPYTSPGRQMVADGVITEDQLSLRGLAAFFASHPEMMDKYLPLDRRYVFFTERTGGPFGSLNVPVTPLGTIATDKETHDIYPRAMPAFVRARIPDTTGTVLEPFSGFLLDQDTGGAIRASGRCDIYMGIGPQAEAMAGHELQQGELYYLAIKPALMPVPAEFSPNAVPSE